MLGLGCEPITGLRLVNRQLVSLFVAPFPAFLGDSGVLLIAGELSDANHLSSRERLPVRVSTSRGDVETLSMWHSWCPDGDPSRDHCYAVTVSVFADADRVGILQRIRGLNMIPTGAAEGDFSWTVVGFNPLSIEQQAQAISRLSGVLAVEGVGVHYAEDPAKSMAAPIRVSSGAPIVGDGRLQLQEGDVLTGTYINPAGDTLRTTIIVPAMMLRSRP